VNNTGGPKGGAIINAKEEEFLQALHNHLICNHLLAQLISPVMKKEGYGRIINIISTSVRQPILGLGVSNTTRGAVASWSKTLSHELAPFGIHSMRSIQHPDSLLYFGKRYGKRLSLMEERLIFI